MMSCDALEKMRANKPLDDAVILLAPGGTMVSESALASMVLPPASMFSVGPSGGMMIMCSSGSLARVSTAPCSTSETTTAKLPPRVIQVLAFRSAICGGILWNSALVAGRGADTTASPLWPPGRLQVPHAASDFAMELCGDGSRPASGFGYNFGVRNR